MESIHHFSHYDDHPLFLKKFGENEEKKKFVCFGCHEQITEKDNYYACQECSFYLHKKCADLPREINLPIHQHPLTLLIYSPYYRRMGDKCSICRRYDLSGFIYHCSLCKFDIDVKCSFFLQEWQKNNFRHEAHPHPLTLILRPSLFLCDACYTKDEEFSCYCNTCQFWIHKSCASAPKSIKVLHHEDPLILAYSLPEQHLNFEQFCDICKERVYPSSWVYYCDRCRYFNHLKCATSKRKTGTGESEIQDEEGDTESSQLIQFPFPNRESVPDPLSLFVANKIASVAYDDGPTEISHRLHHHPISIITTKNVAYNDMICDGCVRPISAPFYSCSSKCNFFLHKFCAELPEDLQCPLDSGHSIKVTKNKRCYDLFYCSFCLRGCNGFLCECVSCHLDLDIGCASNLFPSRIKHDSHGQHPLVRSHEQNLRCNACNGTYGRCFYSCKACSFNLCIFCVKYPGSVRHEYDRHSIPLTYPPIKDHPSDFICEICEEDINPRYWMYHCKDCNQSFHTKCLSPFDYYSNVKFGGKVNIDNIHTHPLTFVRNIKSKNASLCGQCGGNINMYLFILECEPCGFKLCIPCARKFEA